MKNYLVILFLTISLLEMGSCSKDKGEYYNYKNKSAAFDGNLYQYLTTTNNGKFDSMVALLQRVNLLDTLQNVDSVTLVAFTNTSFDNAMANLNAIRRNQGKSILSISQLDSASIDTLICRYIYPAYLTTDSLKSYSDGRPTNIIHYPSYQMNLKYSRDAAEGFLNYGPQYITIYDMKQSVNNSIWVGNETQGVDILTSNGVVHIISDGHEFGFSDASKVLNKN